MIIATVKKQRTTTSKRFKIKARDMVSNNKNYEAYIENTFSNFRYGFFIMDTDMVYPGIFLELGYSERSSG